jgi:hypothetical protein
MTLSLPLDTLPNAGTSHGIIGPLPAPGPRLTLFRLVGLALVSPPGHGHQPVSPGRPRDRSGLWLRNAAAGLGVLSSIPKVLLVTRRQPGAGPGRGGGQHLIG